MYYQESLGQPNSRENVKDYVLLEEHNSLSSLNIESRGLSYKHYYALATVAQLESCPIHQKVTGSIPCQGTYLGCRFCHGRGAYERETIFLSHINVSLPLSLPFFPSKINMYVLGWRLKKNTIYS